MKTKEMIKILKSFPVDAENQLLFDLVISELEDEERNTKIMTLITIIIILIGVGCILGVNLK